MQQTHLRDFYTCFGQTWAVIGTPDKREWHYRVIKNSKGEDRYISNISVMEEILDDEGSFKPEIPGSYELNLITEYYASEEDFYGMSDEEMKDMLAEEVPEVFAY